MENSDKQTNEQKLSQLMDGEWHELNPSECVAGLCEDKVLRAKWARFHMIRDVMKNEPVAADPVLASRICAAIDLEPTYSNITSFNAAGGRSAAAHLDTQVGSTHFNELSDEQSDAQLRAEAAAGQSVDNNVTSIGNGRSTSVNKSLFKTGLTGFAMAASVALVTVVGMNLWQSQSPAENTSVAVLPEAFTQQASSGTLPVVEFVANTGSYWTSPETTRRVNDENRLNMLLSQHIENSPTASREGLLPYSRLVGYDERGLEQ